MLVACDKASMDAGIVEGSLFLAGRALPTEAALPVFVAIAGDNDNFVPNQACGAVPRFENILLDAWCDADCHYLNVCMYKAYTIRLDPAKRKKPDCSRSTQVTSLLSVW